MELSAIGNKVVVAFQALVDVAVIVDDNSTEYSRFSVERQRFQLWSHSLGLLHLGHASLDYRVRDATIVKDRLAEILQGLEEHIVEIISIFRKERRPFEDVDIQSPDVSTEESSESDNETEFSNSDSAPIREVDFRYQSIVESLNALYSLATKIRHPRNRPQRTLTELFKHVSTNDLLLEIRERETAEAYIVAYVQHQQLLRTMGHHQELEHDLIAKYVSPTYWIIRRTAVANVRRKQQFVYWKEHALRLGTGQQIVSNPKRLQLNAKEEIPAQLEEITFTALTTSGVQKQTSKSEKSASTYATTLNPDFVGHDRAISEISQLSRVSTAMNLKGDIIDWPPPPDLPQEESFFMCPYCKTICPRAYLLKDSWRVHLINDLQPFLCTYQDCKDPNRLYGSKQEWIAHENQHTRVWHCWKHDMEFETQPDYIEHLQGRHIDTLEQRSPELIASALGPSEKFHRTCPFCPIDPSEVTDMQKHIIFHLERLATLALPDLDDRSIHSGLTNEGNRTPGSQYVQRRGREESIAEDFSDLESEIAFAPPFDRDFVAEIPSPTQTSEALQERPYSQGLDRISWWAQSLPSEVDTEHAVPRTREFGDNGPDIWSDRHIGPIERKTSDIDSPQLIATTLSKSERRQEIGVVIMCALSLEADAVEVLCDNIYDAHDVGSGPGDPNTYSMVQMGRHKAVILYIPAMGKSTASVSARHCLKSFPNIRLALLTGICGGLPSSYTNDEILLGDVVVSDRLVPYGTTREGFALDNVRKPLPDVAAYLSKQKTRLGSERLSTRMDGYLNRLRNENRYGQWAIYPGKSKDMLFEAAYHHKHHNGECDDCSTSARSVCAAAREAHCTLLGCDSRRTISRKRHQASQKGHGEPLLVEPHVHFGAYASGNVFMKSGEDRDEIGHREKIIAFEMEGAGVWDILPTIIVKGVCDYADGHANKDWQKYAATTAAACVKALLEDWPAQPQSQHTKEISSNDPFRDEVEEDDDYPDVSEIEENTFYCEDCWDEQTFYTQKGEALWVCSSCGASRTIDELISSVEPDSY